METNDRRTLASAARALAVATVLVGASGCQMMGHPPYHAPGKAPPIPPAALGALVFGADGGIAVVDREGRPVPGCVMPGTTGGKDLRPCGALSGTTVQSLKSVGFIRHTGSTCTTIGPLVHAGLAYYFQLPSGCTP